MLSDHLHDAGARVEALWSSCTSLEGLNDWKDSGAFVPAAILTLAGLLLTADYARMLWLRFKMVGSLPPCHSLMLSADKPYDFDVDMPCR